MKNSIVIDKLATTLSKIARYRVLLFCIVVGAVYAILVYQISTLSSLQPASNAVASQSKTAKVPHIDPTVLNQLKSLQDNSVSVKSLFNDARSNPFQE